MRTFFLVFMGFLAGCGKSPEPQTEERLAVAQPADEHSPPREFSGRGVCGSKDPQDTEWQCGGAPLADFSDFFTFTLDIVYQGVSGTDQTLVVYMPDGYTLTFYSTIRCREDPQCVPYVARLSGPPQAGVATQEFLGWVIRINYPHTLTYVRRGDTVEVELYDGRDHVKWPPIQMPSQHLRNQATRGPQVHAHGIIAQVMVSSFVPNLATP